MTPRLPRQQGYTLLELLLTVSIVTIVTSIALPSYQNHVRRSHRSDAMSALMLVANAQEKFYLQNNTYTSTLSDLNITGTRSGFYDLTIPTADVNTFTAQAQIASGGAQVGDDLCTTFTIDATGALGAASSASADTTTDCWR
ncbi:MAG: type IV pilin protein [Gammaproteobacteria bacterium]